MGWLSIFSKKKEPENFETVLEELRLSIQSRQTRLAEIRLRERRASLWVTLYLFSAWALYAGVWYIGWIGRLLGTETNGNRNLWRKSIAGSLVIVGPLLALSARRIVQLWYTRIGNAEEETLKKLLLEQRAKVEELKKKTDFYSTQKLLERYDRPDNAPMTTPVKKGPMPAGPRASLNPNALAPVQNQGAPPPPGMGLSTPVRPAGPPVNGASPTPMHPGYMSAYSPAQPIQPTPRRWFDRLADVVLGEEDVGGVGAHSKYALICKRCFTHNGLVKEADYDTTQFVCMKCGFLNPAPKPAQHQGASRDASPVDLSHSTHIPQLSSPVSPSPSNLSVPPNQPKGTKGGPAPVPVAPAGGDTEEEETPSKRPGQKVTQRRQTRNSRKSIKEVEGHGMELDE